MRVDCAVTLYTIHFSMVSEYVCRMGGKKKGQMKMAKLYITTKLLKKLLLAYIQVNFWDTNGGCATQMKVGDHLDISYFHILFYYSDCLYA